MLLYFAIAIPFILFLRLSHQKIEHLKIRKGKNKIKAKLVKYKTEKETISKNNHTHTNYDLTAYVTLQTNDNETLVCPLNYQKIYPFYKPFDIGEEIEVFWYGGLLYLWNANQEGLYKYVLSKSPIQF